MCSLNFTSWKKDVDCEGRLSLKSIPSLYKNRVILG